MLAFNYFYANARGRLRSFCEYIKKNWIESRKWYVYWEKLRTNNGVEGYHNRLKHKERLQLDIYRLVDLLFREARLSSLNCNLMGQGYDIQRQQTKFIKLEEELFGLWEQHKEGELETLELLALAANLYTKHNNKITKLLR